MPIEIKELHIRVAVNTPQGGQPAGARSATSGGNTDNSEAKDAIVAECVEQILQIIHSKSER